MLPNLRPYPVEAIEQGLEAHRPFLRALAFGGEGAVKVFEDHQRRGVLGGFFKQTENIGALLYASNIKMAREVLGSRGVNVG
jgi:hypothetical protein